LRFYFIINLKIFIFASYEIEIKYYLWHWVLVKDIYVCAMLQPSLVTKNLEGFSKEPCGCVWNELATSFWNYSYVFHYNKWWSFTPSKNKETFEFLLLFLHDVRITKMDICVAWFVHFQLCLLGEPISCHYVGGVASSFLKDEKVL
jgi:hypothetical protein